MKRLFVIFLSVLVLAGCRQRSEVVTRRAMDSIAVASIQATTLSVGERTYERVHEIVVYEADTAGVLQVTRREVVKTTERETENEQIVIDTQNIVFKTFSSETDEVISRTSENVAERPKRRFWRIFGIVSFAFALIGGFIVFLLIKYFMKWIPRD